VPQDEMTNLYVFAICLVAFTAVRKLEPNPRLAYMLMFLTIAVSAKRKLSVRRSSFVLKQSRTLLLVADG
jgi:hypothetical protein